MKKLSLLLVILLLSLSGINAQQNKKDFSSGSNKITPGKMLADAADPRPSGHQSQSKAKGEKEENVKKGLSAPSYFTFVQHKGKEYWKKEKFNSAGTMLYSTEKIHNVALPNAAYKNIFRAYNGWEIKKTTVVKKMKLRSNAPRHSLYYKVYLQNGKDKKRILLDEQGKIYSRK